MVAPCTAMSHYSSLASSISEAESPAMQAITHHASHTLHKSAGARELCLGGAYLGTHRADGGSTPAASLLRGLCWASRCRPAVTCSRPAVPDGSRRSRHPCTCAPLPSARVGMTYAAPRRASTRPAGAPRSPSSHDCTLASVQMQPYTERQRQPPPGSGQP